MYDSLHQCNFLTLMPPNPVLFLAYCAPCPLDPGIWVIRLLQTVSSIIQRLIMSDIVSVSRELFGLLT